MRYGIIANEVIYKSANLYMENAQIFEQKKQ